MQEHFGFYLLGSLGQIRTLHFLFSYLTTDTQYNLLHK